MYSCTRACNLLQYIKFVCMPGHKIKPLTFLTNPTPRPPTTTSFYTLSTQKNPTHFNSQRYTGDPPSPVPMRAISCHNIITLLNTLCTLAKREEDKGGREETGLCHLLEVQLNMPAGGHPVCHPVIRHLRSSEYQEGLVIIKNMSIKVFI